MASGTPLSLANLLKQTTLDDHKEVLNASINAINRNKADLEAHHARVVAYLKLEKYENALQAIAEGGDKLKSQCQLEQAYAYYKIGKFTEAEDIAAKSSPRRGMQQIEAQTAYRLEKFPKALQIYGILSSGLSNIENEPNDLQINKSAVDAQLLWAGQGDMVAKQKPDLEAFETAFNAACISIARRELAQAEILLNTAIALCNDLDELTQDEKEAELLPMQCQQIYVLEAQNKWEKAEKLLGEISLSKFVPLEMLKYLLHLTWPSLTDSSSRPIVHNNMRCIPGHNANPYLFQRIIQSAPKFINTTAPFTFQADLLRRNSLTVDLMCLKYTAVASATAKLLADNPLTTISSNINNISVLNAAAHAKNQAGKEGIKQLLPLLEDRPNNVGLILTVIQLYVSTNNHGAAIALMELFFKGLEESKEVSAEGIRFAPGLVGVLISLYKLQGRKSHIRNELAKAASYWRRKTISSSSKLPLELMRAAGRSLLESSKEADLSVAGDIFDCLRSVDPKDKFAVAGYVASYATTSPEKAAQTAEGLTPITRLIAGIDSEALEEAGVPHLPLQVPAAGKKRPAEDTVSKKKRVRLSRLPKNHDPSKPADPERWLPLRDRSTYRPKGKKGKQRAAIATQGGLIKESEESLELVGGAGALKVEMAPINAAKAKGKKKPKAKK
ncbi:MAG: Signal recognition particle core component [Trizodia sp. TS-e1964]|nr:MAG: Signal recognition particle core component [Trizodia sp. TS-e1964]